MPRLEKFSEAEFMRDVERLGGQALKQDAALNAGIPDRLCWLPHISGTPVWFWAEWKREGEQAKKHQEAYARNLRKANHIVFLFDNNRIARTAMELLQVADHATQ